MLARFVVPTMKESLSSYDGANHQKVNVPGPDTVVWIVDDWEELVNVLLWAALTPSCVVVLCTDQNGEELVQVKFVALRATPNWAWEFIVMINSRVTRAQVELIARIV